MEAQIRVRGKSRMKTSTIKTAIASLMVLSGLSAHALGGIKLVELGLKAGLSAYDIDVQRGMSNIGIHPQEGIHAGIMGRINFLSFHIQPEILYMTRACQLNITTPGGVSSHARMRINTFDFPILVGVRFFGFMRAAAGPVFDLMTDNKLKHQDGTEAKVMIARPRATCMIGLGADFFKRVNVDFRFNGEVKRSVQTISVGDESFPVKTRMESWTVSVGCMF